MGAIIHKLETPQNDKYKSLISDIKTSLNKELANLLANMFNGADDALFHLSEIAESNEDQTHYFDTMRMLRLERKNIGNHFSSALTSYLKPIKQIQKDKEVKMEEEELTLVDQEEMEEMVAISTMHSKAMSLFGDSVSHLEARLEVLALKTTRIFDKEALQPKNICEAFQTALKNIELNTQNKLILYKLFDKEVSSKMEDCYRSLNNLLINEGILPQIKLGSTAPLSKNTYDHQVEAPRNSETVTSIHEGDALSNESEFSVNHYEPQPVLSNPHLSNTPGHIQPLDNINHIIHDFLHGDIKSQSFSTSPNSNNTSSDQCYDRRDILSALSNLQCDYNQTKSIEDFKQTLISHIGKKQGGAITKQVNQLDEKTIDFIEMLFEVIAEDNSISEVITNLLLRLQIPMIKVAMLDEDIFKSEDHPARHLLNLVAEAGKSINNKSDELYPLLENEIEALLKDFDVDIISFQNAIDSINSILNNDQVATEENEKVTQKSVLQDHARLIVLKEMQYRLKGKKIPATIQPLILKQWSTLMFHRYIRNGRDSIAWKEASNILVLLINSLQAQESTSSLASLKNNHMGLIDTLGDFLYETKISEEDITSSLEKLKETYELIISQSKFSENIDNEESSTIATQDETNSAFDPSCRIEEEITLESCPCDIESIEAAINNTGEFIAETNETNPIDSNAEISRSKIANLPRDVRPGVWFKIFNGEEHAARRLKLSVIIMEEAKLIFVDRRGAKVIEKDAGVFTEELSLNKSKIIADHSAFDNALSHVITSLAASV
jgi:hypothetical protein